MDKDNYTVITLLDLVAYFVKKFWVLLVGALVGMVLLLSFHFILSNSTKKVEAFEKDLAKYKAELSSLESTLDNLNLKLDFANEVESTSPIFSNDQIFVSRIMIAVDSKLVSDSESASNAVRQEISSLWSSLDLASTFGSDLDNDVLKASIIFECVGQSATIRVFAKEKRTAEMYASSLVDVFINYFNSREHLSVGSKSIVTTVATKSEIVTIRDQFISDKTDLQKKAFTTEAEIKALKKEAPSKYHPLKNAVIGFFVGGIIVAVMLAIGFVLRNPVTCSFSIEKNLAIPFLGALFIDNCFLSKLARRIMGERTFKSYDDSAEFLKSNFSTKAFTDARNGKSIVIISSVDGADVEKKENAINDLLKEEGFDVSFIGNSSENPLTIKTIEESGAVILFERQWISRIQLASMNKNTALKMGKKVLGFIVC